MKTSELLKAIEEAFEKKLEAKTGWGRKELLSAYRSAVNEVLLEIADKAVKEEGNDNG